VGGGATGRVQMVAGCRVEMRKFKQKQQFLSGYQGAQKQQLVLNVQQRSLSGT